MNASGTWLLPMDFRQRMARLVQTTELAGEGRAVRIVRVEMPLPGVDPLGWVASQESRIKGYWVNRDQHLETAAVGEADEIKSAEDAGHTGLFEELSARWAAGEGDYRYYGGFRFGPWHPTDLSWRPFGVYRFILPEFEVVRKDGGDTVLACNLVFRPGYDPRPAAHARLEHMVFPTVFEPGRMAAPCRRSDEPTAEGWRHAVERALHSIRAGEVEKVVLARRSCFDFETPVDAFTLLRRIQQDAGRCYQFCGGHSSGVAFIGASPERLYLRRGRRVESEAVAGTRPRGATPADDNRLAQDLAGHAKDREEHRLVVASIRAALAGLSVELQEPAEPRVLKLARLQHLYTRIEAELKPGVGDAELLAALHPTPAVGGFPPGPALDLLGRLEPFDRGWYTGPIGWLGRDGAEFAVALRCGLVAGPRLCLFSGAGIVEGSKPDVEWDEIEAKIGSFLSILQGP